MFKEYLREIILFCYDKKGKYIDKINLNRIDFDYNIINKKTNKIKIVFKNLDNEFKYFNKLTFLMNKEEKNVLYKEKAIMFDLEKYIQYKEFIDSYNKDNIKFKENYYYKKLVNYLINKYDIKDNNIKNLLFENCLFPINDTMPDYLKQLRVLISEGYECNDIKKCFYFRFNFEKIIRQLNYLNRKEISFYKFLPNELILLNFCSTKINLGDTKDIIIATVLKSTFIDCVNNKNIKPDSINGSLISIIEEQNRCQSSNKIMNDIYDILDIDLITDKKKIKRVIANTFI